MKQNEKNFFIDMIDRVINAYQCDERQLPGERCEYCPYGYGYLDSIGDYTFWWCNEDKLEKDAVKLLYILKEKI